MKKKKNRNLNELSFNNNEVIVLDIGSGFFKIGFAKEDQPRFIFRSCKFVDKENNAVHHYGDDIFNNKLANEVKFKDLKYAITPERVNFSVFQSLLDFLFTNKLKLEMSTEAYSILIAEHCECEPETRIKMAKILFEVFKFPKVYFGYQPILSMFAQGTTSGMAVDIGENFTQVVPMYKGFGLKHAIVKHELGGRDLTLFLMKVLQKQYRNAKKIPIKFHSVCGFQFVEKVKENVCRVSKNFEKEKNDKDLYEKYILPDRNIIEVGADVIVGIAEILFNPSIIGKKVPNIPEMIKISYEKCDNNMKQIIENNIIITGGSSLFRGMKARLNHELLKIFKDDRMTIKDPNERDISCFVGGSMLASFESFSSSLCVKKSQFEESKLNSSIFSSIF